MRGSILLLPGWLLAVAFPATAAGQPAFVKLSFAHEDASTRMGVSWVTSADATGFIQYGVAAVSENQASAQPAFEFPGIGWMHEVELVGLQPNTRYKYRVGNPSGWSAEYSFKTAPNDGCTPVTFAAVGDGRSQLEFGPSPSWKGIYEETLAAGPDVVINSGDLVRTGEDIEQWNNWLVASDTVNPLLPHMPSIGNHDDGPGEGDGANYNRLFHLPRNPITQTEDYYHFVYNNVLLFALSTQTFQNYAAQGDYVKQVSAQHPTKWKVVYFHHPVYTSESFGIGHEPNEKGQNQFLGPAFDEAGIDLVVMGHNHHYERFNPLRYNPQDPGQGQVVQSYGNGPNDGRMYVISGGAGSFTNPLITAGSGATGSATRSAAHHFVKVAVSGNTLTYSAIRTNTANSSGAGVIETLTVTRPGADPCLAGQVDADGDRYPASVDCDDNDETVNPGAAEICGNDVDEDCDGTAQACPVPPVDEDQDGSPVDSDCDDRDPERYPENPEVECDGIDNDCDCLEVCQGQTRDVCAPPPADAGTGDPDLGGGLPPPADAGSPSADAGVEGPADAEPNPTPAPPASDCNCRASGGNDQASLVGALALLLLMGACRRRRADISHPANRP